MRVWQCGVCHATEIRVLCNVYCKVKSVIFGFGLDKKTKKIFMAPNNLEIVVSILARPNLA